uniref:Uncharacterized protein n=1 Tax=Cucumis sativus TaxID=3659 RepID=A0A0A0LSY2_CUCSA
MKLMTEEEIVIPVDRTAEGVFNRENGAIGDPEFNRLKGDFELIARDGVAVRVSFTGGGFGVCAGNSLVSDAEVGAVHRRGGEVGDGKGFGLGFERGGVGEVLDGDKVEVLDGGVVAIDGGDVIGRRRRRRRRRRVILREESLGLAGEDGTGALPVGTGGADGVGVGDGVVSIDGLDTEADGRCGGGGSGGGGGEVRNGFEEGMGRGKGEGLQMHDDDDEEGKLENWVFKKWEILGIW